MPRKSARIAKRKSARIAKYQGPEMPPPPYRPRGQANPDDMSEREAMGLLLACEEIEPKMKDHIAALQKAIKSYRKHIETQKRLMEDLRSSVKGSREFAKILRKKVREGGGTYAGQMLALADTIEDLQTCLGHQKTLSAEIDTLNSVHLDLKAQSAQLKEMVRLLRNKQTSLESEISRWRTW